MGTKTKKKVLKDALEDLKEEDFKKFRHQLVDRRAEPRVLRSRVERKSFLQVADVLVSTFTESRALLVAADILREIGCNDEAQRLEGSASPPVAHDGTTRRSWRSEELQPLHDVPQVKKHKPEENTCLHSSVSFHRSMDPVSAGPESPLSIQKKDQKVENPGEAPPPSVEVLAPDEFLRHSCDVTLDPNTAYRQLLVAEGNRRVTVGRRDQRPPPDHPERFTRCYQVLSRESLSGCCYWEVAWGGGAVRVAVAYKSISRTSCGFGLDNKSWSLNCSHKRYNFWHNRVQTPVSGPWSCRVGVFLDHDAGVLSFYSISETWTLLHRVQTRFTEPLHAGLWLDPKPGDTAEFRRVQSTDAPQEPPGSSFNSCQSNLVGGPLDRVNVRDCEETETDE